MATAADADEWLAACCSGTSGGLANMWSTLMVEKVGDACGMRVRGDCRTATEAGGGVAVRLELIAAADGEDGGKGDKFEWSGRRAARLQSQSDGVATRCVALSHLHCSDMHSASVSARAGGGHRQRPSSRRRRCSRCCWLSGWSGAELSSSAVSASSVECAHAVQAADALPRRHLPSLPPSLFLLPPRPFSCRSASSFPFFLFPFAVFLRLAVRL